MIEHILNNHDSSPAPRPGGDPSSTRVVWGRASSSNVQAVMWCLAELGLESTRIDAGGRYGRTDTAEYLAINPNGTVPTLIEPGLPPLWESAAILRYLARRYGEPPFWPASLAERTDVDRWAEWAKQNIALNFTNPIFWQVVRTPEARRDHAAVDTGLRQLARYLDIAESRLARQAWLVGEHFTLADIQLGHCLYRYYTIDIARSARPALERYYESLAARSAYRAHVMVSYEELRDTF